MLWSIIELVLIDYAKEIVYLDGVRVPVAVFAQMGRSQSDASLNGLGLARKVAQIDVSLREEILTARSWHVFHPFRNTCNVH